MPSARVALADGKHECVARLLRLAGKTASRSFYATIERKVIIEKIVNHSNMTAASRLRYQRTAPSSSMDALKRFWLWHDPAHWVWE
jgi:hypothetical protein